MIPLPDLVALDESDIEALAAGDVPDWLRKRCEVSMDALIDDNCGCASCLADDAR